MSVTRYLNRPLSLTDWRCLLYGEVVYLYPFRTRNPGELDVRDSSCDRHRSSNPERRLGEWNAACGDGSYVLHGDPSVPPLQSISSSPSSATPMSQPIALDVAYSIFSVVVFHGDPWAELIVPLARELETALWAKLLN